MNFRQFEAFYWAGQLGGFHAAARHLKTSQPTISVRIRDLEEALGVKLFERVERGARPTAKGRELAPYAARLMGLVADIHHCVGMPDALSGRVRFGATNIHALTWLPGLIGRLAASHPGIGVELAIETSETMRDLLDRGGLDIAVLAGPIEASRLTAEPVGTVANVWVAAPTLDVPEGPLSARALAAWPIVSDRPGTRLHGATREWFREEGVEPERLHSCPHLTTRIHLAAQGLGVALAARSAVEAELARGALRLVATHRAPPALAYVIAYSDVGLSPCGQAVVAAARALIAEQPDLDAYYAASRRDEGFV